MRLGNLLFAAVGLLTGIILLGLYCRHGGETFLVIGAWSLMLCFVLTAGGKWLQL